jgi:hypothetical protein
MVLACDRGENRERTMDNLGMRVTLTLGLLALAMAPAHAERYIVEPIVDTVHGNAAEEQGFSQGELDQLLAPIALYPDALLSQVLIAATYPLEIVEAARWSRQNPRLEGDAAVEAVASRDWDPSVKALVAFPDLLAQMDEDLDWTRRLGDAMLFQEEQVMDSIQFLRARADAAGHLETNEYARVIRQQETIIIEPAQTRVVYVPYYDPHVVYGTWWRPAYPPVYWAAPPYYHYGYPGFYWGSGIHLHSGFFFSNFYWPHRSVVIVHTPRFHHSPRYRHHFAPGQRWQHNPRHRRGVDYRHREVRQRFDQPRLRAGPVTRWPLESGAVRGSHDGTRRSGGTPDRQRDRTGERNWEGRSGDSSRADRSGNNWRDRGEASGRAGSANTWRDRDTGTTTRGSSASPSSPAAGDTALRAGPRTVRPSVGETEERLRDTRRGTGTSNRPQQRETATAAQRFAAPSQRATAPSQRSTAPAYRSTTPSQGSAAPAYRATTPTQRWATPTQRTGPSQRAAAPTQQTTRSAPAARQGHSSPVASPAPTQQPRAAPRASGRGAETRAAPNVQRESRGSSLGGGEPRRDGRRAD